MPRTKRKTRSAQPAKTASYHQTDQWAIRYLPAAKASVTRALSALGEVKELPSQRLLLVRLAKKEDEGVLTEKAKKWIKAGRIEFCQPVLRDVKSQLQQIPTDEISVRFKQVPSGRELRTVERKYGVKVDRQNEFVPNQFVVKAPATPDLKLLEVASKLDAEDDVEFATPNFLAEFDR
jgi:hypothetical protein